MTVKLSVRFPRPSIHHLAFSGPNKKTLYGVANNQRFDEIYTIPMIAQGLKGQSEVGKSP